MTPCSLCRDALRVIFKTRRDSRKKKKSKSRRALLRPVYTLSTDRRLAGREIAGNGRRKKRVGDRQDTLTIKSIKKLWIRT